MDSYDGDVISNVRIMYIIAIFIWVLLVIYLELYITDFIGTCIIFIPIIFYLISMFYFDKCNPKIESEIFQYDLLAFGVVIITVFISYRYAEYSNFFYKLIFVGIFLLGISMLDLWLPRKELVISKHFRNILQTAATVIFIYLFYSFYYISYNDGEPKRNPFSEVVLIKSTIITPHNIPLSSYVNLQ